MKLAEFLPWTHAVGWTLIHSLWQAVIVSGLVFMLLRCIPSKFSQLRYGIACAGLSLTVFASVFTFIYLTQGSHEQNAFEHSLVFEKAQLKSEEVQQAFSPRKILSSVQLTLQPYMPVVLFVWCFGATLFMLRMVGGWWYVSRLQAEATPLPNEWHKVLQYLAQQLKINSVVSLAQSTRIHAPIVIGFIKPVVLIPAGMISGLSTEQIETIFIHELAHIRRHDYLINLMQSFVEALFFFNPFVWMLSGTIRREREYCCDDTVLIKGNPLAYAHALARLEEARLSKAMFALALAENKNQLLNRIKRIMEKSAKNYSGKDRLIPALLIVVGLVCASWLTIHADRPLHIKAIDPISVATDTVIKKQGKAGKRSRTTIITYDETGKPHKEVVEEIEGDVDVNTNFDFDFEMPPIAFDVPDVPSFPDMPSVPGVILAPDVHVQIPITPAIPSIPGVDSFDFPVGGFDTIPGAWHFRSQADWEEFSEAFEEKFREQFSDFYETHEKDFEKMTKDLEKNFATKFNEDSFRDLEEYAMARAQVEAEREELDITRRQPRAETWEDAREARKESAENMRRHEEEIRENQHLELEERARTMRELDEELKQREKELREVENKMKVFQEDLKKMLVKDGYLNKEDEIKNINWDDDGEIEVNGKKIKPSDRKKYNELYQQYFTSGHFRYAN